MGEKGSDENMDATALDRAQEEAHQEQAARERIEAREGEPGEQDAPDEPGESELD